MLVIALAANLGVRTAGPGFTRISEDDGLSQLAPIARLHSCTRPFRLGDHIKPGYAIGDIAENNFPAIQVITSAINLTTISSFALFTSNVISFNASIRETNRSLIPQTTIAFDQDIPWRQACKSLIVAALPKSQLPRKLSPFPLQTGFGIMPSTTSQMSSPEKPDLTIFINSWVHTNIQQNRNGDGISIPPPDYTSATSGTVSTIPTEYLPADYAAPPFRIAPPHSQPPAS